MGHILHRDLAHHFSGIPKVSACDGSISCSSLCPSGDASGGLVREMGLGIGRFPVLLPEVKGAELRA